MYANLLILCLIVFSFVCVYKCENCDIKLKYALYSLCAIIFIIQLQKPMNNNTNEYFTSDTVANEALQNIASVYNNGVLTVSKLNVTGDLAVAGKSTIGGDLAITGDTFTRNLTTTNAAIGSSLTFKHPTDPQGVAWALSNYDGTLFTNSTKSGSGGIQTLNDPCGAGSIATRYLQPGGMWKMAIGTSRTPNANTYAGLLRFGQTDGRIDPDWREHSC